jgi:Ca2+-transporting ATPase
VADMILQDDSFSSIVIAIKQGRIIFENIRKFVIFLLSCNLSELVVIATVALLNLDFQLVPLQILFINLITDVLPALALGVTEGGNHIMQKPPRNIHEPIIDRPRWIAIIFYSVVIGSISIGAVFFRHFISTDFVWHPEQSNNILFFTLIFSQLLHVLNMGSGRSFFRSEVMKNNYVWYSILISAAIVLLACAVPSMSKVLSIHPMAFSDWFIVLGAGLLSVLLIQIGKNLSIARQ